MKKYFLLIFAIAFAALGAIFSVKVDAQSTTIEVEYGQTEARSMLKDINSFRQGNDAWYWNSSDTEKVKCKDLGALKIDYTLEKIAMKRAAEIATKFSHERPSGQYVFTEMSGYGAAGENIAYGYSTADSVLTAWKETNQKYAGQGHRRNMLGSSYTVIGIGHAIYKGTHYWVQVFGQNAKDTTYQAPVDAKRTVVITSEKTEIKAAETKTEKKDEKKDTKETTKKDDKDTKTKTETTTESKKDDTDNDNDEKCITKKITGEDVVKLIKNLFDDNTDDSDNDTSDSEDDNATPSVKKISKINLKEKKKVLKINWTKQENASGYQLQISTKKSMKNAKTIKLSSAKANYTRNNINGKKTYYVRVRAFKNYTDENGNNKVSYGSWKLAVIKGK